MGLCCVFNIRVQWSTFSSKYFGGVMVSVFASSAVDRGFEPDRVKSETIKCVCVASPLSTQKAQWMVWLGIRRTCPSVATCLSAECCLYYNLLWYFSITTSNSPLIFVGYDEGKLFLNAAFNNISVIAWCLLF
jgi:hypothetical protein